MQRRKRNEARVDLIGFLDIISVLNVLILLIISFMSLGLGSRDSRQSGERNRSPQAPQRAMVVTNGGVRVTSPVSFLMCSGRALSIHNPDTGAMVHEFKQGNGTDLRALVSAGLEARVYLAVKPSCFGQYRLIEKLVKATGSSIGVEPIEESALFPWGSAGS